jgi:hypothetical protein
MPQPRVPILGRWVHERERDSGDVQIYRREDAALPLSRLPRELLEIRDDHTASRLRPGPADARVREDGTWEVGRDGRVVLRWERGADPTALELIEATTSELRFRARSADGPDD